MRSHATRPQFAPRSISVPSISAPGHTLHLRCDSPTSPIMFVYTDVGEATPDAKTFHTLDNKITATNEAIRGDLPLIIDFALPQNWGQP
jgi:hypothetical protein